uniref:CTD15 n=1 Tax=Heliconius melpomene TaxID=34740 RepID=A0A2H4RMP7_HELME|nr:CTD15 [Heliconius melpomene]
MKHAPKHSLLEVSEDEMEKVRKFYGIDENAILQDMEIIEEWGKKQEHLVEAMKYLHREILERIYLIAKGSVEATKNIIEKLFTIRGMMSELTLNKSIGEFNKLLENIKFVVMPKLTEEQSRVIVIQFATGKWDDFNFLTFVRYYFMLADYRLHFDYNLSETFIVDLKNLSINDITKLNPMTIKKGEILSLSCYGVKINSIHIVNAPSFVDTLITILKQALRENLVGRLHVHSTYEDLHKATPKDIIPENYGGNSLSVEKLSELWQECFTSEEARQIVENTNKLVSDESKRSSFKFNEEYLGMPGSFKKLAVD